MPSPEALRTLADALRDEAPEHDPDTALYFRTLAAKVDTDALLNELG